MQANHEFANDFFSECNFPTLLRNIMSTFFLKVTFNEDSSALFTSTVGCMNFDLRG